MNLTALRTLSIAVPMAAVFALGAWAGPRLQAVSLTVPATAAAPAAAAPIPALSGGAAPNYRAIVARYGPAVVGITVDGSVKVSDDGESGQMQMPQDPFGNDPFFRFFRNLPTPRRMPMHGLGSGFIVSPDGLILTNAHVVRDADRVTVKLADRREYKAKVLGVDTATDIAVIKIDAHDLPTVQTGDSDQLAVGDYVLAIGAPYGFEESATSGIVSAKGRSLPGDTSVPFIQTDVAVNPGNSGGPLFDAGGRVVGINSQIYSNTGGYEGLSFAIPIKVAMQVKDQIVATGKAEHARLGVMVQPLTQPLAQSFQLDRPDGALVSSVSPDSAASRAGVQPGDVILAYNGQPLTDAGDLSARVGMARPGDKVELKIWRDHRAQTLEVKLGEATQTAGAGDNNSAAGHGKLGLALRPLTPEERQQADVPGGLLVEEAADPAASAGIQPGDIVLSANGTTLDNVHQLRDILAHQKDQIALLIVRGDTRIFVPVPLA
jgi:serine protease Do